MLLVSNVTADDVFLDFEEPVTSEIATAPNPYFGSMWSDQNGDGSDLGVMNIDYYNTDFGGSLDTISGNQVGWSRFGFDNITVSFSEDYVADSLYLTPWIGFGPASMQVDLYDDGNLVGSVGGIVMTEDSWTFVDLGGVIADEITFRNFGNSQWFLIEDVKLSKVPEPSSAMLLFSCLALGLRRKR